MILRLFLGRNTFSLETDIWQPLFQCWLILQTYNPLICPWLSLEMISISFHSSFKILIKILMCFFFHVWVSCCYGQENTQSLQTSGASASPERDGRQENKKGEVALSPPSSSSHSNICCYKEEFGVTRVGIDCLWVSSDTFDHYEKQHNFQKIGIIIVWGPLQNITRADWDEKGEQNSAVFVLFLYSQHIWTMAKCVGRIKRLKKALLKLSPWTVTSKNEGKKKSL